jgi:UDP-glucose 4-epimerase
MHYLITGGTGYIGSHMAATLYESGHTISIIDNFSNSNTNALKRLQSLCNDDINFRQVDLRDKSSLLEAIDSFESHGHIDAVLHFAGLKAVGESFEAPLHYYQNNVFATLNLLEVMREKRIWKLVFSSSATVYGEPERLPVDELCKTQPSNPYGRTKLVVEEILADTAQSHPEWRIASLRYFNPAGAHESGKIGEEPQGTPNNLMPYVFDVAFGKREKVSVFGDDYNTQDGTGVRDYIHVMDLVEGHQAALSYLDSNKGYDVFNLGTGTGYSVLEMIKQTQKETGNNVPYSVAKRRNGDLGVVFANPKKAKYLLQWQAKRTLKDMIRDQARWMANKT